MMKMHFKHKETHIWYIYHSGFAVKTAKHLLIFDYYRDSPQFSVDALLERMDNREIIVFASHGHGDHFSPTIFDWQDRKDNIKYVLSHDIITRNNKEDVTEVYPGQKHHLGEITVETLESTDLGVAFLVNCDGITIFHAGDLNWWHWEGEPAEDNQAMEESYKEQVDKLTGQKIDLAFIPVDPRLEEQYALGLVYFMQVVGADMVFPMHFGNDYSIFQRLKEDLSPEHLKHVVDMADKG